MTNEKPRSAVRKALGDFAPKLVDLTEDVLFSDVWERPQISKLAKELEAWRLAELSNVVLLEPEA